MKEVNICGRLVGDGHPPLVIPEIGINHGGSEACALALQESAFNCGAEVVKWQCHSAEDEMLQTDIRPANADGRTLWDVIEGCQLTEAQERRIQKASNQLGIGYLSTPFSYSAVEQLNAMGVEALKIGSGECDNLPFVEYVSSFGKPIILSTGMTEWGALDHSVEAIKAAGCDLVLLHCVSMYPAPASSMCLPAIKELKARYGVPVGISDHSMGISIALAAVALGACVIEKHFTISRDWPGPDDPMSIEPSELAELITESRRVWQAMRGFKHVDEGERPIIEFAKASVVTTRPITKGHVLCSDDLTTKRPSGGIPASDMCRLIGKTANQDMPANVQVRPEQIGDNDADMETV